MTHPLTSQWATDLRAEKRQDFDHSPVLDWFDCLDDEDADPGEDEHGDA